MRSFIGCLASAVIICCAVFSGARVHAQSLMESIEEHTERLYGNLGPEWEWCNNKRNEVEACTKFIESGKIMTKKKLAMAHLFRGTAYGNKQDYANAEKDFSKSLSLDPQSADTYMMRACVYAEMKQFAKSQKDFDSCIRHKGKVAFCHFMKGRVYVMANDKTSAEKHFKIANQMDSRLVWDWKK